MSQEKYDIFISYSRKDTAIADQICAALDSVGITYFIDRQGIGGGFEFPAVLAENIVNSKLFLLLASKNSYESKFTMSEIVFAFNKKPKNAILPYIIDNSSLPISLEFVFAGINWRNMTDHPIDPTLVDDLLKMLGRKRVKKVVEDAEVTNIQQSESNPLEKAGGTANVAKDVVKIKVQPSEHKSVKQDENPVKVADNIVESVSQLTDREKYLLSLPDWEFVKVDEKGKCGFKLRSTGEIVIPLKYDDAYDFREGLVVVKLNGKWGFIDKTGKEITPLKYDDVRVYGMNEGMVAVEFNDRYGYIDHTGKEVTPIKYYAVDSFVEGLAGVALNGCGFIDKTGKEVIPLKYDSVGCFTEGLAKVKLNNKWGYIDN
ncbi:MAG: WG repeat-containing protein [Alistipes sp.]|nr:WG repeat-containing protein [Alistipes sp.]